MEPISLNEVAESVPFEYPGWTAENVRDAILEAKANADGKVRFLMTFGSGSTVSSPKYLDFFSGVSSDVVTFVAPSPINIFEASIACNTASTATVGLRVDGVLMQSITITNADSATFTGLNVNIPADAHVSVKIESGTLNKAIVNWLGQKV